MAGEMCVNPVELARAAWTAQLEGQALAEDLVTYRGPMALFRGAFGRKYDRGVADATFTRYNVDYQAAMVTVERLVAALEEESDALFQTASVCLAADQYAAGLITTVLPASGHQPI